MPQETDLDKAIAHLEAQRLTLGDEAVDAAIAALRAKLGGMAAGAESASQLDERRLVTVMFADISGFTSMAETMDPETLSDLINNCFERLVARITIYDGTIDKFIGDEVMALFGAPRAHENDAERAVRAALEMREAMAAFNAEHSVDFGLHFGINTGLVFAGKIGAGDHMQYSVLGDTVNLASRLKQAAKRGQILIGSATYQLVQPLFDIAEHAPVRAKGKSKPVPIFEVLGTSAQPGYVRGLELQGLASNLVGRQAELDALGRAVAGVQDGRGGIIGLIGEAGVGKSRLVLEAQRQFASDQRAVRWLEGGALSSSQTTSYWPFQVILHQWAGITTEDSEREALNKLNSQLLRLAKGGGSELLPYVGAMLSLPASDFQAQLAQLDSEAIGRRLFQAVRRLVRLLAQERPLVLVFEDLHWIDESSASLVSHLLPLVEEVPVLIIGVSRPNAGRPVVAMQEAALKFPERYTEIQLQPLRIEQSEELFNELLNIEGLPKRTQALIIQKSGGNPFYLEELIRTIILSGDVIFERESGSWRAANPIDDLSLPDTLQGVVLSSVDKLDTASRRVLQIAAVIGETFPDSLLRAIAGEAQDFDQILLTLQERGHIAPVRRAAELRYRFQHALAQEAVYNGILRQTRRELHAVVAHTIETIYKDRLEEFYGMLSFHYALAEQWDEARSYMLLAGNRASEMAADAEAVALYRQAIVAYERALGARWAVAERADVYRKMGEAYFRLGNHEEALAYLQRALADLGRPFPNGRPAELLALSANLAKQAWYRVRGALARRRSRTDVEPQVALVARLYESLSWITGVNPEQVLLYVLSSANYSERHAYVPGLILSYAWLQTILDFAGLAGLGGYYGQKSLQLTDESRFPAQTGTSYAMRAVHENIRGRWSSSLEYAQRANDLFHATDHWNVRAWTFSKLSLADGNIHLGQFATALEHATELELFGEESSDRQAWCWGLARQGFAYRGLGQTAVAGDALRKAMDVAKSIPDYQTYVDSGGELGHCLIRQGDLEEALHVFSECAEKSSEHNLKKSPVITRFLNGRADALLKLAEAETGPEREKKLEEAVDACHKALAQGKVYVPGMPEAQMLAGTLAWLQGNRSAAEDQWQKSIDNAAGLEVQFDLGRALLEAGSRLENVAFLRRAEDIFEQIEAQWELGIAQNKLAALQRG